MKKLIILNLVVAAFATASFSQQVVQQQSLAQADYLNKSRNQKTVAWILLGGGFGLFTTGLIFVTNNSISDPKGTVELEQVLLLSGANFSTGRFI